MLRAERRETQATATASSLVVCVRKQRSLLAEQQLTSAACERGQQSAPEHEQRPRATQCQTSLRRGNCYASRVPPITNIEATVAPQPTPPSAPSPPLVGVRSQVESRIGQLQWSAKCSANDNIDFDFSPYIFVVRVCSRWMHLGVCPPRIFRNKNKCLRSWCRQSAHCCGLLWEPLEVSVTQWIFFVILFSRFSSRVASAETIVCEKSCLASRSRSLSGSLNTKELSVCRTVRRDFFLVHKRPQL